MSLLKKLQMMLGMGPDESMPDCEEVLENLFEYLDGELGDLECSEIEAHLDACKRCYPRAEFERTFLEAVRRGQSGECCPDAVRASILAAIQSEGSPT